MSYYDWRSKVGISLLVLVIITGAFSGVAAAEDETVVTGSDGEELLGGVENGTSYSATSSQSSSTDGSIGALESSEDGFDRQVAITAVPKGSSFNSDGTMNVFVGALNDSGVDQPLSGVPLNVTIQRPGGSLFETSVTTGAQGYAQVDYDLSGDNQTGTYEVTVADTESDTSATISPDVGPSVIPSERDHGETVTDTEHRLGFLVRNGEQSVAGEQVFVQVEAPDGTITDEQTIETGSDGFANITVTPTQTGHYDIEAEVVSTGSTTTHGFEAGSTVLRSDWDFGEAIADKPFRYGGYLEGPDGLLRNEPIQVVISNQSGEVKNISTSTDSSGFLLIESQIDHAGDYTVDITTPIGSATAVSEEIYVVPLDEDEAEGGDGSGESVVFDVERQGYRVSPGSNATFDANLQLADGSPIANKEIQVSARLDYNGAPIYSGSVTTDETGSAVIEIPAPADIDGGEIEGRAQVTHNGTSYGDGLYTSIQQYDINANFDYHADVGSTTTISASAETLDGSEGVANIPVQYYALRGKYVFDSYASGELITDQSGQAEESVTIPRDLRPSRALVPFSRVDNKDDASLYSIGMFDFPAAAEITGASGETDGGRPIVTPGEQISVNFTTENGSSATGFAFTSIEHQDPRNVAEVAIADNISTKSNATLTIPDYAKADDYQEIQVWAADAQGLFYVAEVPFEIARPVEAPEYPDEGDDGDDASATATASVSGENVTVAPSENTTLEFAVTNTGGETRGHILNLSLPEELTPVEYENAGGTPQDDRPKWLWQNISVGETVTPSVTLRADETAAGTYPIVAEVKTNSSIVAETTATVSVSEDPTFEITELTTAASPSIDTPFTYTAEVTNTGDKLGTQTVEATFDGETVTSRELTLNGSEQATLAFTTESPTAGTFTTSVSTANDTRQVNIEVVGQEFIRGQSTGDPHITTYSGESYDFMAAGDFVLATEPQGDLHVVARQAPIGNSVSNNNMTATTVGDARVVIDAEAATPLSINGSATSIPDDQLLTVDNGAGKIARQGSTYVVYYAGENGDVTDTDEHLTVDVVGDRLDIELALHPDRNQTVEGLLGNTTKTGGNDITFDNGTALPQPVKSDRLYGDFRSDWRATGEDNLFADSFYVESFPASIVTVESLPAEDRNIAESVLAKTDLTEGTPQYRDALIDLALTGDSSYVASAQKVSRDNVSEAGTALSVPEAIDTNNNNEIDDQEILTAIEYWQMRELVPGTDGERIGDFEILELIEQWRYNSKI